MRSRVWMLIACAVTAALPAPVPAQWTKSEGCWSGSIHCFLDAGETLYAGGCGEGTLLKSTNNGATWTNAALLSFAKGHVNDMEIIPDGAGGTHMLIALGEYDGDGGSGIYRSSNGISWTKYSPNTPGGYDARALVYLPGGSGGPLLYAGCQYGLYRSSDAGASWLYSGDQHTSTDIRRLVTIPSGTAVPDFIAATGNGLFISTGGAYTPINSAPLNPNIKCVTVVTDGPGTPIVYAGTESYGVFRSTDRGATWTEVNTGLTTKAAYSLLAVEGVLFCGTYGGGVFMSSDQGSNWSSITGDLGYPYVISLGVSGPNLIAGTGGGGTYHRPLAPLVTSDESGRHPVPGEFRLHQNYPNPFNPGTVISFELPGSSLTNLRVLDIHGRSVAVLVDGRRDAGVHTVTFDATGLASGVYFYRLQTEQFTDTKRLMILK